MKTTRSPIVVIGILFFVFGFVTWLGSVLIPYFRIAFRLTNLQSYLVAFSFYISYMVMALPSGWVLQKTGYKKGMSLGLLIMALGTLLFIPAAIIKSYPLFLSGLFVQGTGLAILQTASNPYVTILGPMESAARRISIMGICNGVAGVIAPLVLGAVVLHNADGLEARLATLPVAAAAKIIHELTQRVIIPYGIMSLALTGLAILVIFSGLPELNTDPEEQSVVNISTHKTSIFQFPHLLLGVITLFLYVGVEVIAGDTIIRYGSSLGIPLSTAKFFTSATLTCMLAGYVIGIICIPRFISQVKVLQISAIMGLLFVACALSTSGIVSVACIALLGLANSLVWPSIWPLAISGLGKFTPVGSSLLIMAIGGGALLPLLYGKLADMLTPKLAYWVVVPCYLCILFYAVAGHKIGKNVTAAVLKPTS